MSRGPRVSADDYYTGAVGRHYSPDGKRFLMVKLAETGETFHVVPNWTEELKRLVPAND